MKKDYKRIKILISVAILSMTLTGCASVEPTVKYVEVWKAPEALKNAPARPVYELEQLNMSTATNDQIIDAYKITINQCINYSDNLDAILKSLQK